MPNSQLPIDDIAEAKLVLTDALVTEALRFVARKHEREARGEPKKKLFRSPIVPTVRLTARRDEQRRLTMAVSANRLELMQIADAVAREKSIDRGIVIAAMEDADRERQRRSRYGSETDVHAEIDLKSGELLSCRATCWSST